jgi:hypothetical protein
MNSLPSDYNWQEYIYLNPDLTGMTELDAYYHYTGYGKYEKRKYKFDVPILFNWKEYIEINPDLNHITNELDAKKHYIEFGKPENRKYSFINKDQILNKKFDYIEYIELHNDLNSFNKQDAINHFINYGINENRLYNYCSIARVFIISNNNFGGTYKYVIDIINNFKHIFFVILKDKSKLYDIDFKKGDIILVQQLLDVDIAIEDILYIKNKFNIKLIVSIHDTYWLNKEITAHFDKPPHYYHGLYLDKNLIVSEDVKKLFSKCYKIIFPSKFIFDEYAKYFNSFNFIVISHNDYKIYDNVKNSPLITNNQINIGVYHSFSTCKGSEAILLLIENYQNYNNIQINFFITGYNIECYNENTFNDLIEKYNIHGLLSLNKWGETYSYALTKYLNSGLPIFYNNFGAFKERIPSKSGYHVIAFDTEDEYINRTKLFHRFEDFLNKIILNNKDEKYTFLENKFEINNEYNKIFYEPIYKKNIIIILDDNVDDNDDNNKDFNLEMKIETIQKVRTCINDSYIILYDSNELNDDDYDLLNNNVDIFINDKKVSEKEKLQFIYEKFIKDIRPEIINNIYKVSNKDISLENKLSHDYFTSL